MTHSPLLIKIGFMSETAELDTRATRRGGGGLCVCDSVRVNEGKDQQGPEYVRDQFYLSAGVHTAMA